MSLEAWGDDGDADRPYTQERVDELIQESVEEYRDALIKAVEIIRTWHDMDLHGKGGDLFDIYYRHSPEMKPIRDLLK